MRRGGRSTLGRGAVWPRVRTALLWLWLVLMVAGLPIGVFYRPGVGVGAVFFGIAAVWLTWAYDNRWRRLQHEVFRKRGVPMWRRRLARRLLVLAGQVDPYVALCEDGSGFVLERGIGKVYGTPRPGEPVRGCPLWYMAGDLVLAHEHAEERM